MASPKKDLLEFEKAIEYMDPMQVTEYLDKTLDFLKRNNSELCFPNVSPSAEAFLVRLVAENKNLKSKSLSFESKEVAIEIIDVLEMNRDVFRWTYGYENGRQNKNLLVYKKIYSTKLKMNPIELRKPISTVAHRLINAQTLTPATSDVPTGCKTQLLNMTLRFIKTDTEHTLLYPEMPLTQAEFLYTLIMHPENDSSVGFGYKSLYAPLFEALHAYSEDYVFEVTFVETSSSETTALKLEKKPRKPANDFNDSSKDDSSLNNSISSTSVSKKKRKKNILINGVTADFVHKTMKRLLHFTASANMARVTFERLSGGEVEFIKGVKSMAASTKSYGNFDPELRESLKQLNSNVDEVIKTCKLRIEEGVMEKSNFRFLTVKKCPRETVSSKTERAIPPANRSKSTASVKSRDRSLSKDRRIKFASAGQFYPNSTDPATDKPTTDNPTTDKPTTDSVKKERGRSSDRLNARKTKLLEDMSVPLESDRAMRMMKRMGWSGGALGARGDGILEPIVPSIELPPGAGLGHVPPAKPEKIRIVAEFRAFLLQNILELLQRNLDSKEFDFKIPLNKKERNFLTACMNSFNNRKELGLGVKAEVEMCRQIVQALSTSVDIILGAEVSKDLKKITLIKSNNPSRKRLSKIINNLNKPVKETPITMTVLNTNREYELITEESIYSVIHDVIPKINTTCKTPAAIRSRATRMLFLQKFIQVVNGDQLEKEFRFAGVLQKRLVAFLKDAVMCVNIGTRSTHVTSDELGLFRELAAAAEGWMLSIAVEEPSKIIFSKTPFQREYHKRFYNSALQQSIDNNNDAQTDNQNQPNTWANVDNDTEVIENDDVTEDCNQDLHIVVEGNERKVNILETEAIIETVCDIECKDNEFNVTNVDKDFVETDETSLCVCDTNVDISGLDRDIQELEQAISEVKLNLNIKTECDAEITSLNKRSRSNSVNSQETNIKRSKFNKNNFLIISPNDPDRKINTEIIRKVQTKISDEIDKCTHSLPQLQCHGVQNIGLIYSCLDDNDVEWLKTVINDVHLDLKVIESADVCLEQKSRKMVIKINSFIPLESKKAFNRLEIYNTGLQTQTWKVLAEQTFSCYIIFIVEIDENSFEYISKENFSLYVGIDKARFSLIF